MAMKLSNIQAIEMANQALVWQKTHGDFDLRIRDLQKVWGYKSTSAAFYRVPRLVKMKLIRARRIGKNAHVYRAVEM